MTTIPEPLVAPDVDLRDFQFMPLDIARLFNSEFHARSNDSEWRAGVTLWLKSYHQVPCASLPDDEISLARLAELGRDVKGWRKVRAAALHGWVKCSDGRWYHPVVAEKAMEAWAKKQAFRDRTEKARLARLQQRQSQSRNFSVTEHPTESVTESKGQGQGQGQGQGELTPFAASGAGDVKPEGFPDCPHDRILALYAEKLPELPQPRIWEGKRQDNLRARWRWVIGDLKRKAKPHDQEAGIAFFARLFDYVRRCPLLMGEKGEWSADLGWIVGAENFAKILQGNYEKKEAAA